MRTALTVLLLLVAAPAAVIAAAPAKPGASPAPTATAEATPKEKAPEPGNGECSATSKDGALIGSSSGDYQACLRNVKAEVAKACDGTKKQIEFVFHRGGQKAINMTAVCN